MIAAITLKMLDPFGTGKLVLFQVTYDKVSAFVKYNFSIFFYHDVQDWHAWELLPFVVLGIFGVSLICNRFVPRNRVIGN